MNIMKYFINIFLLFFRTYIQISDSIYELINIYSTNFRMDEDYKNNDMNEQT